MTVFRDWRKTLSPASYRGVPFFVEHDDVGTGRRLVVHEFPMANDPYVEDLGRAANEIKVTAYLVSNSADDEQRALLAACDAGGAATLVLPMDQYQAHCKHARRSYAKDKLGYVAVDMEFVRDGVGAAAFSVDLLARLVEFGAGSLAGSIGLPGPLRLAFTGLFQGLGVAGFVTSAASGLVREFAGALSACASLLPMDPALAPDVLQSIADLYADADDLVACGSLGNDFTARAFVASGETRLDAVIVDRVCACVAGIVAATPAADSVTGLGALLDIGDDWPAVPLTTPSRRCEAQNQQALTLLFKAALVAQWAAAVTAVDYTDRRAAIQARADAAEHFDAVLDLLSGAKTQALWTALYDLQGKTCTCLSRQVADLAPVLSVGAGVSMPALWWANRLYGDANRAGELAARNRIKHPLFMPRDFEALAS